MAIPEHVKDSILSDCPCPQKSAFRTMGTARRYAIMRAMRAYRAAEAFGSMYGYRCVCGMIHVTQKKRWNGVRHPLLARIRPARILVEQAYDQGRIDAQVESIFV
jgi:hypothetical protein